MLKYKFVLTGQPSVGMFLTYFVNECRMHWVGMDKNLPCALRITYRSYHRLKFWLITKNYIQIYIYKHIFIFRCKIGQKLAGI